MVTYFWHHLHASMTSNRIIYSREATTIIQFMASSSTHSPRQHSCCQDSRHTPLASSLIHTFTRSLRAPLTRLAFWNCLIEWSSPWPPQIKSLYTRLTSRPLSQLLGTFIMHRSMTWPGARTICCSLVARMATARSWLLVKVTCSERGCPMHRSKMRRLGHITSSLILSILRNLSSKSRVKRILSFSRYPFERRLQQLQLLQSKSGNLLQWIRHRRPQRLKQCDVRCVINYPCNHHWRKHLKSIIFTAKNQLKSILLKVHYLLQLKVKLRQKQQKSSLLYTILSFIDCFQKQIL